MKHVVQQTNELTTVQDQVHVQFVTHYGLTPTWYLVCLVDEKVAYP